MLSTDIEKEIRSAMEGIKEFKHGVDIIGVKLSDIDDRLSEPSYSKEFVDDFKDCCYRLAAPVDRGGIRMRDMDCMFGTIGAYKVLEMYSAERIVKIIREYDKKKELEREQTFRMRDEVQFIRDPERKGIVLNVYEDHLTMWTTRGYVYDGVSKNNVKKTGKHFDSIDYWIETELRKEEK